MTDSERQRRRYERKRPERQFARITAAFLAAEQGVRTAFFEWLRKKRFMK